MIFLLYSLTLLFFAILPVAMFITNLRHYRIATLDARWLEKARAEKVSVLIPARNEEQAIGPAIDSILTNRALDFELLVLDDQSEDATADRVRGRAQACDHVRLVESVSLPDGWNGKQHACWRLAAAAQNDWLLFLDADVRLSHDAIQRIIAEALRSGVSLLSGFPCQETGTLSEKLLIPLMHFILLGYLPLQRSRVSTSTSLAAGCGQLMLARRQDYFACDGHRAIRESRHDGLRLPKAFRQQRLATDIFDATDIARCRMYRNRREVVAGLLKNANEGIANRRLIAIFTVLLAGAVVLPIPSLIFAIATKQSQASIFLLAVASFLSFVPRMLAARRFHQDWIGVLLHPMAIAWFLGLQWYAWWRSFRGQRVAWRGRF